MRLSSTFRPSTLRLLELLGGTALYGEPRVALREAMQNAMDAVKERLAILRLEGTERNYGEFRIDVSFRNDSSGSWIIICDNGAGMDRRLLQDFFLVSGETREDLQRLEERCSQAGFTSGRTGQFGIGVLSYFMLADHIIVETSRAPDIDKSDARGWRFTSSGPDTDGTLEEIDAPAGTKLQIRLREKCDAERLRTYYAGYIKRIIARPPCPIYIEMPSSSDSEMEVLPADWNDVKKETLLAKMELLSQIYFANHSKPAEGEIKCDRELKKMSECEESFRVTTHQGENRLGPYRIHLVHFQLPDGDCAAFFAPMPDGMDAFGIASFPLSVTWKGVRGIELTGEYEYKIRSLTTRFAFVEWDLLSGDAGRINIARDEVYVSDAFLECVEEIQEHIDCLLREFAESVPTSRYDSLNYALAGLNLNEGSESFWFGDKLARERSVHYQPLQFPICVLGWPHGFANRSYWNGEPVLFTQAMEVALNDTVDMPLLNGPHRIVFYKFGPTRLALLSESVDGPTDSLLEFPESWSALACMNFRARRGAEQLLWNREHPLAQSLRPKEKIIRRAYSSSVHGYEDRIAKIMSSETMKEVLSVDVNEAILHLASIFLAFRLVEFWNELLKQHPADFEKFWGRLSSGIARAGLEYFLFLDCDPSPASHFHKLIVLHPDRAEEFRRPPDIRKYLPEPSEEEWWLVSRDD